MAAEINSSLIGFLLRLFYAQTIHVICIHRINQVCKASLYATTWDFEAVALVDLTGYFYFLHVYIFSQSGLVWRGGHSIVPTHQIRLAFLTSHITTTLLIFEPVHLPETSFSFSGTPPRPVRIALTRFCPRVFAYSYFWSSEYHCTNRDLYDWLGVCTLITYKTPKFECKENFPEVLSSDRISSLRYQEMEDIHLHYCRSEYAMLSFFFQLRALWWQFTYISTIACQKWKKRVLTPLGYESIVRTLDKRFVHVVIYDKLHLEDYIHFYEKRFENIEAWHATIEKRDSLESSVGGMRKLLQ